MSRDNRCFALRNGALEPDGVGTDVARAPALDITTVACVFFLFGAGRLSLIRAQPSRALASYRAAKPSRNGRPPPALTATTSSTT